MTDRTAARNAMLAVITVLLVAAGLRASYSVTMPLAAAIVWVAAAWPIKPWLDRKLPSVLSYVVTALILLIILVSFVSAVYFCAAQIVRAFAQNWDQLEHTYQSLTLWVEKWGFTLGGQDGHNRLINFGQEVLSNAYTIFVFLGFIAILMVLGLPEVEALKLKIAREYDSESVNCVTGAVEDFADKIRLYLGVTTLTSVLTGVASAIWALIFGLDLALV